MSEPNRDFGKLLSQGLKSIAAREHKPILLLEDELGYEMTGTRSRWSIEKWRQGMIPANSQHIAYLARACVRRGGMDKQWLIGFLTRSNFPHREELIQELFPGEDQSSANLRRNVPGRSYERLIGREQEIAEIEQFLSSRHRTGIVCLTGIGGVGKTALALEVAHRMYENYYHLSTDDRFEAIIWVTAKQTELLPAGITSRNPSFKDLNSLYQAIAEVLDLPAITRTVSLAEREVLVAQVLAERRILLILDNLEDVDDQKLMVFLRDLPTPSKAIVTTRHRIGVAVPIRVLTLKENQARELIKLECQRLHLSLTADQTEKLLHRVRFLPLAIVLTLGRMAWRGSNIETELRLLLNGQQSDFHEFCFGTSIAKIRGRDAHKLFMVLALFSPAATREAVGYIAGFKDDIYKRDEAFSDLEILSLVNKGEPKNSHGAYFRLEPLIKVTAYSELTSDTQFEQEVRKNWIEWYRELLLEIEQSANYSDYKSEVNNVKSVIEWLIEQDEMEQASWFFRHVSRFFFSIGRWGVLVRQAQYILDWAERIGDVELLIYILRSLTSIYLWQADFTSGEILLERIQSAATLLDDVALQAEVRLNRVKILVRQDAASREEIATVTEVLDVFRTHHKTDQYVDALNTLGNLYLHLQRFEDAVYYYQEGLHVVEGCSEAEKKSLGRLYAALQGNLGHAAGRQGQFAVACNFLKDALSAFTDQADQAEAYASLALYEYHLGHKGQAQVYRQKADRLIEQLSMRGPICPEDEEWSQLVDKKERVME